METKLDLNLLQHTEVSGFAYELLRGEVLFNLLGKEINSILYWEGKSIATNYPLESMDEIIHFFEKAGWGNLLLVTQKKNEMELELTGDLITYRSHENKEASYQLEAGFLAQQIQVQRGCITEAYEQQKRKDQKVIFTVQWDPKDIIE